MEVSGESPGRLFDRLILPDARAVGGGLPGLPGSCHSELLPPSPSGRTVFAVALLLHALARPGFTETFAVRGVDGVFSFGFYAANSFRLFFLLGLLFVASSPSTLVAGWSGSSGACLPPFPPSFSLESSLL